MEESIVQCIDHLQTQLKKTKKKLKERKRREAHQHEAEWTAAPAPKRRAGPGSPWSACAIRMSPPCRWRRPSCASRRRPRDS